MRILLDTHTFIWLGTGDLSKVGEKAIEAYQNTENSVFVSMVSFWEMAIKLNIGKLTLSKPLEELIKSTELSGIAILPISCDHIINYQNLPLHHNDPFDRLIISTAYVEKMTVLSRDPHFSSYENLSVLW